MRCHNRFVPHRVVLFSAQAVLCVLIVALLVMAQTAHAGTPTECASWEHKAQQMEAQYSVAIVFDALEFPPHWQAYDPQWTPVPVGKRVAALRALAIDLARYDLDFLTAHVARVYIYDSLRFMNTPYGGTTDAGNKWLYIHADWLGDTGVHGHAMGLHHELSSLVLNLHTAQFPDAAWRAAHDQHFGYVMEDAFYQKLLSGRTGTEGNPTLPGAGFLCDYGQLALEEDLNTYAQYLIAKPGNVGAARTNLSPCRAQSRAAAPVLPVGGVCRSTRRAI
jgi:hypothetical protein